jgi:hypothetical protein
LKPIRILVMLLVGSLMYGQSAYAKPSRQGPSRHVPVRAEKVTKPVSVEMMVVHATNKHNRVDPRLRSVMQNLGFMKFTGFDLLSTEKRGLRQGDEVTMPLVKGREVRIRLISRDAKKSTLRVRVFQSGSQQMDTTISVHRNRSFIIAGPRFQGGVLILPLAVKY